MCEVAGVAAIEIEDQLLPRRVEHHVGVDHLVPTAFMLDKITEARAARTDPDLVIIARTNARRVHDLDEALRRAEAFHKAGADMLFVHTRDAEETAHRRRAPAAAADDVRAARRVLGLSAVAARLRRPRLSARRLLGHRVRRHGQGGAPVVPMPGAETGWIRSSAKAAPTGR